MASLNPKLKAFVKYSNTDEIIPSVLVLRTKEPTGGGWVRVPVTKCCTECCDDLPPTPGVNTDPEGLKAFIKYDRRGIVVAGSTIVRRKKPAKTYGDWVQIPYRRCCETTSTTTTTTTTVATTTTSTTTTTTTTV